MMTTYVPCSRSSPSHECIYSTPWYMVLVPWWVPVMKNVPVCRRIYNFRPYILTDFRIQALVCLRAALLFSRLNCFSCIHFKRYVVKRSALEIVRDAELQGKHDCIIVPCHADLPVRTSEFPSCRPHGTLVS